MGEERCGDCGALLIERDRDKRAIIDYLSGQGHFAASAAMIAGAVELLVAPARQPTTWLPIALRRRAYFASWPAGICWQAAAGVSQPSVVSVMSVVLYLHPRARAFLHLEGLGFGLCG
jgi:hypothetical protein